MICSRGTGDALYALTQVTYSRKPFYSVGSPRLQVYSQQAAWRRVSDFSRYVEKLTINLTPLTFHVMWKS